LREGYARALKESELIAEAKKARMDMEAVSGEELQTLNTRLMTQPAAVIQRVKKVLEN
jgi:hypothetical protein